MSVPAALARAALISSTLILTAFILQMVTGVAAVALSPRRRTARLAWTGPLGHDAADRQR